MIQRTYTIRYGKPEKEAVNCEMNKKKTAHKYVVQYLVSPVTMIVKKTSVTTCMIVKLNISNDDSKIYIS